MAESGEYSDHASLAGLNGANVAAAEDEAAPLRLHVQRALTRYFEQLDGETPRDLYALVLAEVEGPLLDHVMGQAGGNQSRAAAMLGLNRGTLRKKLKAYGRL